MHSKTAVVVPEAFHQSEVGLGGADHGVGTGVAGHGPGPAAGGGGDAGGQGLPVAARGALWRVMHDMLILLHPLIPFVTEEIWSQLPGTLGSIMQAIYPADNDQRPPLAADREAETAIATLM